MRPFSWLGAIGGLLAVGLAALPAGGAETPWERGAFAAEPAAVLEALDAIPAPDDVDVHVLLEEETYRFDAQGLKTHTLRRVYRCMTEAGAEDWSFSEGEWSPWCEERPEIRARVITPNGKAHQLDPKNLAEVPVDQDSRNVYVDRRMLRGPLPAVRAGAAVEEQVVTRETQPFFARGEVERMMFLAFYPIRKARLVIEAPADLPLRYEVRGIELKPRRTEREGRVRLDFEAGPFAELEFPEPFLPPDVPRFPQIVFSTGESWASVAAGYAELFEPQLKTEQLEELVRETLGNENDRNKVAALLLKKVQERVRYTGVEFGQAAIVPRTPRETLARGFGDCKDQSALLVAMLRVAGIPAHVALLRSGRGADVRPGLPGLGFSHAIVYVPGQQPLWIDPTARYVPPGELPIADQGRLALVAAESTTDMVRTPLAPSGANRAVEIYDLTMTEWEGNRVRETVESTGSPGEDSRNWYASHSTKEHRSNWKQYGEDTYGTRSLERLDYSPPDDFSGPFRIVAELAEAAFGYVDDTEAVVSVFPSSVFDRLPSFLTEPEPEEPEEEDDEEKAKPEGRQHPLWLPEPHVCERVYRITPPPGFVPQDLPEDKRQQFGPVTLSREFSVEDERVVVARFLLDTGDGRLKPDEAEALHRAILELGPEENVSRWEVTIKFENPAERHLEEGRIKEGIAAYRELLEKNPDRAEQHARYAWALLHAGLGEAARREVRRAVELAPQNAEAHAELGRILTHDLTGRHLREGMDWQGAAEAYRKALELDPDNLWIRFDYAILLEHVEDGARYTPRAKLDEAAAEYRKVRKELQDSETLDLNLALVLLYARKYAELEELVKDREPLDEWAPLQLAAIAAQQGATAAEKKAVALFRDPDERRDALLTGGDYLQRARLYGAARQLYLAGAPGAPNEFAIRSLASSYQKLRPFEEAVLPEDDPRGVVQRLYHGAMLGDEPRRKLPELFVRSASKEEVARAVDELLRPLRVALQTDFDEQVPPERTADIIVLMEFTSEGDDDAGYRIGVTDDEGNVDCTWYVVREEGAYRVLPAGPSLANLGAEALRRLDAGDAAAARRWLDRAWAEQKDEVGWFNPFSGTPFGRIWWTARHDDPAAVRLAAAALVAEGPTPRNAIPILLDAEKADRHKPQRLQVDRALARAYLHARRPEQLLETAEQILARSSDALEGLEHKLTALWDLERNDDLRRFLKAQLDRADLGTETEELLAWHAGKIGEFAVSEEHLRPLVDRGRASPLSYNELAWNSIFRKGADERALEDAQRANRRTLHRDPTYLHTLAAVCAELGHTADALDNLHRSLDARGCTPENDDWYVLGRIAEDCGLADVAADLYRKVARPERPFANDTWVLAERRLKGLQP